MDSDRTDTLRDAVLAAAASGTPIHVVGGGTKSFYGRPMATRGGAAVRLETAEHRGILSYEPSELVLTARSGTPLAEMEAVLAENGQMLAFEPPHFGAGATLGGAVAAGLSGPRRAFAGAVRDFVLGCRMINGKGEVLRFGGQVIKNVAGFDVARLMVGAMGTLGLLLEISLKVLPRPECERTLVLPMGEQDALAAMVRWPGEPWPLSGLAYDESWVYLRLAGAESSVAAAAAALGGAAAMDGPGFWQGLREQEGRFFNFPSLGQRLWRISLAPAALPLKLAGHWFLDWGGALRWLRSDEPPAKVFAVVGEAGGHATLFRGEGDGQVFQPLPAQLLTLHRNLKQAFDPAGLFNPGRLYEDF